MTHAAAEAAAEPKAFAANDDFVSFADCFSDEETPASSKSRNKTSAPAAKNPRKRTLEEADLDDLQQAHKLRQTPWIQAIDWDRCSVSATKQLSAEVAAFVDYITPTAQEHDLRTAIVQQIRNAIVSRFPDADVQPFGSFQTQLYLPSGCAWILLIGYKSI